MSKWYPQDIVKTKSAADRMAEYHRKHGFRTRIRRMKVPIAEKGKVVYRYRYYVDIATP